jgi:hypothetical protein
MLNPIVADQSKLRAWTMACEYEDYFDKFDQVDRLAERVSKMGESLEALGHELRVRCANASVEEANDIPTVDQIREAIAGLKAAQGQLLNMWNRLPAKIKASAPHKAPSKAGEYRMKIPD